MNSTDSKASAASEERVGGLFSGLMSILKMFRSEEPIDDAATPPLSADMSSHREGRLVMMIFEEARALKALNGHARALANAVSRCPQALLDPAVRDALHHFTVAASAATENHLSSASTSKQRSASGRCDLCVWGLGFERGKMRVGGHNWAV